MHIHAFQTDARGSVRQIAAAIQYPAVQFVLFGLGFATFAPSGHAQFATPSSFGAPSTGNFAGVIPIRLPPATGELAPRLAIAYDSHFGNGPLGVGWTLQGLSAITRCPQTVAQDAVQVPGSVTYASSDRFCLDGSRLIALSNGTYGANGTQYRTEIDSFSQITSYGTTGSGPTYFVVKTKSGLTQTYGNTASSGVLALGTSSIRVWALSSVADTVGNSYSLSYTIDAANGAYYPYQISFTANAASSAQNTITFTYRGPRTDTITTWTQGSMVRIVNRLSQVTVTTTGGQEVREYRLGYDNAGNANASRLTSVQECASSSGPCLPTISIGWSGGAASAGFSVAPSFSSSACGSNFQPASADFNGDGRADYLCTVVNSNSQLTGQFTVILSNGGGSFTVEPEWPATGSFCANKTLAPFAADFNGDGKADLLCEAGNGTYQVALSNGDGTFNPGPVWPSSGTFCGTAGEAVFAADVNGDGRTDLVCSVYGEYLGRQFVVALSNGDGTFTAKPAWPASANFCPAGGSFGFGDFNGDGMEDLICASGSSGSAYINTLTVAISNGDGTFTPKASWNAGTSLNSCVAIQNGDFNGDGKQDVFCQSADSGTYAVAFSRGDGTFSVPGVWPASGTWCTWTSSGTVEQGSILTGDFNGDGRQDVACLGPFPANQFMIGYSNGDGTFSSSGWYPTSGSSPCNNGFANPWASMDVNGTGAAAMVCVDEPSAGSINYVASNSTPDLVTSIGNGIGYTTTISYLPLTNDFYTKDSGANAAVYPTVDVQAPYYVVSSVQISDGVGGTTAMNYAYAGLKLDLTGRGSLGFRSVTATNAQTSLSTITDYFQAFPYTGQVSSLEKYLRGSGNGGALTITTNTSACMANSSSGCTVAAGQYYFPYISTSVTQSWDLNGAAYPNQTSSYIFDSFGNPQQFSTTTSDGFSRTTYNTYNNDTTHWFIGQLQESQINSVTP